MSFLLSQCHIIIEQHFSILVTLFLAGLVGGVTHCAGMCGPFVIAQTKNNNRQDRLFEKLSNGSLLFYHIGRMTTYMMLGAIAAIISRQIIGTSTHKWVSTLLLVTAGMIFILTAFPQRKRFFKTVQTKYSSYIGSSLGKLIGPLLNTPRSLKSYFLGIFLGFLPCGLIFASLMVVSTTGNPYVAAFSMALFTIGTMPSLLLVGFGGSLIYKKWPTAMQIFARGIMVINGVSLFMIARGIIRAPSF